MAKEIGTQIETTMPSRLPAPTPCHAMMLTPAIAKVAAIQLDAPGFSPVIQGLSNPVKIAEEAPITETVAVLTMVSDVT